MWSAILVGYAFILPSLVCHFHVKAFIRRPYMVQNHTDIDTTPSYLLPVKLLVSMSPYFKGLIPL